MGVYLVNFLVYAMAMVGLLFVCLMIFKKTMLNNKFAKNNNNLAVENALNLSQRKTLYVVKAGNEKFLIAADVERTSFLAKLDENTPSEIKTAVSSSSVTDSPVQEAKPIDYSGVMAAIKKTGEKKPVMREMLRKLNTVKA